MCLSASKQGLPFFTIVLDAHEFNWSIHQLFYLLKFQNSGRKTTSSPLSTTIQMDTQAYCNELPRYVKYSYYHFTKDCANFSDPFVKCELCSVAHTMNYKGGPSLNKMLITSLAKGRATCTIKCLVNHRCAPVC